LAGIWFPSSVADHVILSTVGMSACMGTVIKAPLTSTLIVFEMTHQFEVIPGLMLSAVISQLIARFVKVKHNFYDSLLFQDGHELMKIKPPRDLQSWQNLPVSYIMNKKPVIIRNTEHSELTAMLTKTPFNCFPYIENGSGIRLLTRSAIMQSIDKKEAPVSSGACIVSTDATIRHAADNFINSPHGFLIIADNNSSEPVGILTLHDLLRAQAAVAEQ
jgi:CIC family chloride channel protein